MRYTIVAILILYVLTCVTYPEPRGCECSTKEVRKVVRDTAPTYRGIE